MYKAFVLVSSKASLVLTFTTLTNVGYREVIKWKYHTIGTYAGIAIEFTSKDRVKGTSRLEIIFIFRKES